MIFYPESLISGSRSLVILYDRLIEERKRTSIQAHVEDIEVEIFRTLTQLIDTLKSLRI